MNTAMRPSSPPNNAFGRRIAAPRSARGFSLVELMVSMTIGLLIIVAISAMYVSSSAGKKTEGRFSEFQTNARYAMDVLRKDVQHAGFYGLTYDSFSPGAVAATDYGCGAGFVTNILQPVYGLNDTNSDPATSIASCVPSANYGGGDILVLRRAGPESVGTCPGNSKLDANTLYLRSGFDKAVAFHSSAQPLASQQPCEDYPLLTEVYYVSPATDTENPPVPALYRLVLETVGSTPTMTPKLVASNVEDFQVQYGIRDAAGSTRFYNASELAPDQWNVKKLAPDKPDVKKPVSALRIWILARSSDKDPGYAAIKSYQLGGKTVDKPADGYQRQVFQQIVQVRQ